MAISDVFADLAKQIGENPAKYQEEVDGVFKFALSGEEPGNWIVDCKDNVGVRESDEDADCTMSLTSEDFAAINSGELDGMQAFMLVRIQVYGDMGLAMKLQTLL